MAKDEVAGQIQLEVSGQLEELGERTREAVSAATQKVIAEFDRFGESLLGKETYWQNGQRPARGRSARTPTWYRSTSSPARPTAYTPARPTNIPRWTSWSRGCPASARRRKGRRRAGDRAARSWRPWQRGTTCGHR